MYVILDTDPGIDDACTIAAALNEPSLHLLLLSAVGGNVSVENTAKNALRLVEFFGKKVPVAKGCSHPLLQEPRHTAVHGETGMSGYDFPQIHGSFVEEHAVIAMWKAIMRAPEAVTLVAVGPLTNVALLFRMYPEVLTHLDRLVLMGGSDDRGNMTPYAEFNIYVDPEAAQIVFDTCEKHDLPVVLCGLNMTRQAVLTTGDFKDIDQLGRAGHMLASLFSFFYKASQTVGESLDSGARIHDLTTIAYLVHPEYFETKQASVTVDTTMGPARGATVVNYRKPKNVTVCQSLDNEKVKAWLKDLLRRIEN